ncbi:MAG: thiamine phosphate synthase [Sphaerochaetaceae bacterium]|nr:thiamine phosphate synthase [Sphaerochaetaceae bacterium]
MNEADYSLYLVTDRNLVGTRRLEDCLRQALDGGVTMVQLREKDLDTAEFIEEGRQIKAICDSYGVPLVINDSIIVACKVKARAVHLGQSDLDRSLLAQTGIPFGVSVTTVKEALEAEALGASYIGVGAMYETPTKQDASIVSFETLKEIRKHVSIPIVTIGGMNEHTIPFCLRCKADGVAVVSAILSHRDIGGRAAQLKELIDKEKGQTVSLRSR